MIAHSAPWLTRDDHATVSATLASGMIASGALSERFAEAVRQRIGARRTVTAASGMDALTAALKNLGVGRDDEVIIPTYVCSRVRTAVAATGAQAIMADVGPDGNLSPPTIAAVQTSATKAIVAAHIFGQPCDIAVLRAFEVPIVEDACQAFAIPFAAGMSGMLGDIGVYSFQATKCLAAGEGGMIVFPTQTALPELGDISELSDLQAALGLSQLARYDDFLARRSAIGRTLRGTFDRTKALISHLPEPEIPLFRFTIRTDKGFDEAQRFFAEFGVAVRRGVDALLHRDLRLPDDKFPMASHLWQTTVSLPCYPALSDDDLAIVVRAAEAFARDY